MPGVCPFDISSENSENDVKSNDSSSDEEIQSPIEENDTISGKKFVQRNESGQLNLQKGMNIRFRKKSGDEDWHTVSVISSAGKKTGPHKNWYNVKEGNQEYAIDLSQVNDMQIEEEDEEVYIVMVPKVDHGKQEVIEAKGKELGIWKSMDVYEEVPDVGQDRIQTCWLISEKEEGYKARLVVRGDQESSFL